MDEGRFAQWLAERLGAPVMVGPFTKPEQGFSNDTWLTEVDDGTGARGLVVRLAPSGVPLFPRYDIAAQAKTMELVGLHSNVAVPTVRWTEADVGVLGRPFFVMDRVYGRIPSDGYLFTGWVKDLAPDRQATLLDNTLAALAGIHSVDWQPAGLEFLADTVYGSGIERELRYWFDFVRWAEIHNRVIEQAYEWCLANRPVEEPSAGLVWGDARLGNVVFGECEEIVAVLDWEMASLGPAELDLGWYLFLERIMLRFAPQLEGFCDRESLIGRYQGYLGRPVADLYWYEVWAGVRAAAINHRLARLRGDAPTADAVLDTLGSLLA